MLWSGSIYGRHWKKIIAAEGFGCEEARSEVSSGWWQRGKKRERRSKRNCTIKTMESIQIESKRTYVGSNIETDNGQKSDIRSLGLSVGSLIPKKNQIVWRCACENIISNLKINFMNSKFSCQKWGAVESSRQKVRHGWTYFFLNGGVLANLPVFRYRFLFSERALEALLNTLPDATP